MTVTITYPSAGRGAWPTGGDSGTLDSSGKVEGPLYRSPQGGIEMPGLAAYSALKAGAAVDINHYAVYTAVKTIQTMIGAVADGLFGQESAAKMAAWQDSHGLTDDGQYGRITSMAMWLSFVNAAVNKATTDTTARTSLRKLAQGHIGYESDWDLGAVGETTPQDLGLGQINGPAHPALSVEDRFNPRVAIPYVVYLVQANLVAMKGVEEDAIAAYNLGVGGATEWVRIGRPEVWKGRMVKRYIRSVLAAAQ